MDISEEFLIKFSEETDLLLMFLFEYNNCFDESSFNKIIENEDLHIILKLLKYKLILIHNKKAIASKFDIEKLCDRIPENNFIFLHDILLYSLIIQPSVDTAVQYLNKSYSFLNNNVTDKNNNVILYHLEIIDVIFEFSIILKCNIIKKFDAQNHVNHLIVNLISNDENNIRRKITTDIIPKYITCTENYNLFSVLWQAIKNYPLETGIVIALEQYFIYEEYNDIYFNILNLEEFWINLQKNMYNVDNILRKQAHYLLKKCAQTILNNESYIKKFDPQFDVIKWETNNFEEYKNAWKNFFILCEVSSEKQIHLIEPSLKLYNSLKPLHFSWRNSVTKLFILHPHSAVVKLTIINILKGEWYCDTNLLIQGLNNNFLYEYNLSSDYMSHLNSFVYTLNRKEYLLFIQEVCNAQMSPVPFYHVCKSISVSNLKNIDLQILINLIQLNDKIPHLYIRKGILHSLFMCFLKLLTNIKIMEENDTNNFVKIIYMFHCNNYLQRGNIFWQQLVNLLLTNRNIYENTIAVNNIYDFCLLPNIYSVFVVLLIDAKILHVDWIQHYLQNNLQMSNKTCKLDYFIFLFNVINTISKSDEIFEENYFTETDLENIFNEIFNICNNTKITNYSLEFFESIEFIFGTILDKIFINENVSKLYLIFLEKLAKEKKILCYVILSKKIIQAYELNLNVHKTNCKEQLTNLSKCLKNVKCNYDVELKCIFNANNIKQKFLQNYYYTKLNIIKILFKISERSYTEDNLKILEKVNQYYDKGGLEIILLVIDTLKIIANNFSFYRASSNFISEFINLLNRCKKDIFNLRTNDLFRPAITLFISTILHPQIFNHEILKDYVNNFCLNMFDSSQIISGIRNDILCRIRIYKLSPTILVEGLLFGQILRKDQRIEFETCNMIYEDIKHINFDIINPWQLDGKVRSKSVALLLTLIYKPYENFKLNQFCEDVLKLLKEKYNESAGKRYFGDSQIHLVKLRIMQSLHLIVPKLKEDSLIATVDWLFNCLVNESQQPSIKILIQWLMVRIYEILNEKEKIIKNLISQVPNLKGTSCTAIFPLLYHLVKDHTINIDSVYDCMEFLLPYIMGQQFNIRFSAQVTIQRIYEIYSTIPEFSKRYESIYITVTKVINQTDKNKLNDNILTYYNLSPTIQILYYDIPRLTNVTQTEWLPLDYFSGIVQMKLRTNELENINKTNLKRPQIYCVESENENMNIQKKIDPLANNLSGDSWENRENPGNLIVVASLINKAPNLGGLSRTCEVFGVKQYVLNNIQFMKNKEYQSLSMSSEKWIDTFEVKNENLLNYLLTMKKKNYKIIGAEQTSDSKKLNSFKFDKNTVLLLGNEKQGIPPNLIHLLDECIEIPQFGQIRSLNVHVAGALFIWEYAKQHCTNI